MSKRTNITDVLDGVLAEAKTAAERKVAEVTAVKTASAQPRTAIGQGLRALAHVLRSNDDAITYTDLGGVS